MPMPDLYVCGCRPFKKGAAQNESWGNPQVLVFGSTYSGAIWVHLFEPQPNGGILFLEIVLLGGGFLLNQPPSWSRCQPGRGT